MLPFHQQYMNDLAFFFFLESLPAFGGGVIFYFSHLPDLVNVLLDFT